MTAARTPVTGGARSWPVFDRHGERIHVGDTLRAQCCVGRYGQTRIITFKVKEAYWPYCQQCVEGCVVGTDYDRDAEALRCAHVHNDFEHGHETWAEIVKL